MNYVPSISHDGRYVAFESHANNIVAGDTNTQSDIFVHDRQTGQTTRVSVDSAAGQGNGESLFAAISGDGRYVTFASTSNNLVLGDTNNEFDIFVHDRQTGQTTRVNVDSAGAQALSGAFNVGSHTPSISADGRYVSFQSYANNLVPDDGNGAGDAFFHDRQTGQTTRVSVNEAGAQGTGTSLDPVLSGNGRHVAFVTFGAFVASDDNGVDDVYVHDRIGPADADGDGQVTTADAAFVMVNVGQPKDAGNVAADIDGDGLINALDAVAVINRASATLAAPMSSAPLAMAAWPAESASVARDLAPLDTAMASEDEEEVDILAWLAT